MNGFFGSRVRGVYLALADLHVFLLVAVPGINNLRSFDISFSSFPAISL